RPLAGATLPPSLRRAGRGDRRRRVVRHAHLVRLPLVLPARAVEDRAGGRRATVGWRARADGVGAPRVAPPLAAGAATPSGARQVALSRGARRVVRGRCARDRAPGPGRRPASRCRTAPPTSARHRGRCYEARAAPPLAPASLTTDRRTAASCRCAARAA